MTESLNDERLKLGPKIPSWYLIVISLLTIVLVPSVHAYPRFLNTISS